MIARDAEHTLGACLDSVRPWIQQIVCCVDELTTDATADVARAHGADVVVPIKVSDWHECEQHGRVLAQHFGQARNESFTYLDASLDAYLWIDADDILDGGEHLAEVLAGCPDDALGYWVPYVYASAHNHTAINTVFDRERLLRARAGGRPIPWRWEHRVHEVVKPADRAQRWVRTEAVRVLHQEGVHKSHDSAKRNLLLLEIDLEERPDDSRSVFYVANQYFAMGRMPEAADWYERLTGMRDANPYERWQSFVYQSIAFERMGDLDQATRSAFCSIDTIPDHPEPYLRLASIYCAAGEFAKTVYWDRVARQQRPPPPFVFTNPMDLSYNSKTILADALGQMGRFGSALRLLEEADAVAPNEKVEEAIARYRGLLAAGQKATGFVALCEGRSDEDIVALYRTLPEEVKSLGRTRDVAAPAMLRLRALRHITQAADLVEQSNTLSEQAYAHAKASEAILREMDL